jgi:hypothetical protein
LKRLEDKQRISNGVREEWGNFREAIKWKGIDIPGELAEKSGCENVFCDEDTLYCACF